MTGQFTPLLLLLLAASPIFAQASHHDPVRCSRNSCTDTAAVHDDRFNGNRKMAELLDQVARKSYNVSDPFATSVRINTLGSLVESSPLNEIPYIQELINGGRQDEAIPRIIALEIRKNVDASERLPLQRMLASAYLRQGEQDNCITNHGPASCLFPIGPGGFYAIQRGPRAAIEILRGVLNCDANDLQSRWLLNIAYMTIDEYPDSVPSQWLIPPDAFTSEYSIPRFNNVAPALGVDEENLAGGVVTEDFDLDGDIDILTSSWGPFEGMRYYRNNGDGTFTDATRRAHLKGLTGGLNMIQADYNNDGYPDVLVLRGAWLQENGNFPNSLLRNNGDGSFTDVTAEAGLLGYHPTQTAVFADLNNDGWLDIFIGNESVKQPHACELYINNGNGTFTERAREMGLDIHAFVKAVACADYDNDGLPDLYLSCFGQTNHLLHNNGMGKDRKWSFTDVTEKAGVGSPVASFPAFFFDYDNDGWDDIFVCGYGVPVFSGTQSAVISSMVLDYLGKSIGGETPRLYHNNHNGTFSDATHAEKLDRVIFGMGCNFGDIDNDGYPDIYIGTGLPDLNALMPNRMFRNNEGKFFQDVTTAGGVGHLQKGHAIAFADLDNDGDQDIYAVMGGAFEGDRAHKVLFENPGNDNHWITLMLEGKSSNRSAIGARIKITATTPRGDRTIFSTVNSGGSFGASTLQQEIGLGDAMAIRSITITWPTSKTVEEFRNVAMNHFYKIKEDAKDLVYVDRPAMRFNTSDAGTGTEMGHRHE